MMNLPEGNWLIDVLEAIEQSPDYVSFTEFVQTELDMLLFGVKYCRIILSKQNKL